MGYQDMRAAYPLAALAAMIWFAGAQKVAHAQEKIERPIPEIKADHPDRAKLMRLWGEYLQDKEIQRLQSEAALRKGHLDRLKKKQNELLHSIRRQKRLLKEVGGSVLFPSEVYFNRSKLFAKRVRYPLAVYDLIEKWIPEYEEQQLKWMKSRGKTELKYSLHSVWQWAIQQEEKHLKNLEYKLEGLPERIEKANQALSEANEELKNAVLKETHPKLETDDGANKTNKIGAIINANGTGELFDKNVKYLNLKGCGNADPEFSMKFPVSSMRRGLAEYIYEYMGLTMSCPGLTGGKIVEFHKVCNEFNGANPPMTARVLPWGIPTCWPVGRKWRPPKRDEVGLGLNVAPLSGVCEEAYFGRPASREEQLETISLLKFTVKTLRIECFYIKRSALKRVLQDNR